MLDLACGTGRVLLPILSAGIDVDGCDISADMLQHCRARAAREGLRPTLFAQPMHAFSLPRTYRMIYICDSFGLGGSLENDLQALRRCHAHLAPGGALVLNVEAEYTEPDSWAQWLREKREALPEPWPDRGQGRIAADGSEHSGASGSSTSTRSSRPSRARFNSRNGRPASWWPARSTPFGERCTSRTKSC